MKLVSDCIWRATFVQCPKCNDGVHILSHIIEYEPESAVKFGIDGFERPIIRCQPHLCKCGHVLTHEEIVDRSKQGYTIPSIVWVCPNCSCYQSKSLVMTNIEYKEHGIMSTVGNI